MCEWVNGATTAILIPVVQWKLLRLWDQTRVSPGSNPTACLTWDGTRTVSGPHFLCPQITKVHSPDELSTSAPSPLFSTVQYQLSVGAPDLPQLLLSVLEPKHLAVSELEEEV